LTDYYIGQVGIPPKDFWINTWKENQLLGESHSIKENLAWERTRYLATLIYNSNVGKKSQQIKPHEMFYLPQDHYYFIEKAKPKTSREQYEAFKKSLEGVKWKKT